MKILLIYRVNIADKNNHGIWNKMIGIEESFRKLGHKVDVTTLKDNSILCQNSELKKYRTYKAAAFSFFKTLYNADFSGYDMVWVRYGLADKSFIRFIQNLSAKIIVEIPTYPYDLEFTGIINQVRLKMDQVYRRKMKDHIDLIVHYGREKEIYDIPSLPISNGLMLGSYPVSKQTFNRDTIHMAAIGKWNFWHGLDRIIRGMKNYTGDHPIKLTVIGEGPAFLDLKNLSEKLKLGEKVVFVGSKSGEELDTLYADVDIGIGVLGLHRKQLEYATPLKHREYVARGLPVVHAGEDPLLKKGISSIEVPADDGEIDAESIINSYLEIIEKGITKSMIREEHLEKLSWDNQVKKILDYCK